MWEDVAYDSLESPVCTLVAANGQELELLGQGEVELKVGDLVVRHVVLVTKSLTHDCLLGAHGCIVDLQRKVVLVAGKSVPLVRKPNADEDRVCHVTVADTVPVQASCELRISSRVIQSSGKTVSGDVLFEPKNDFMV